MSTQLHDKYLIYRIQTKRDAQAYTELYDRYVSGVYRFVSFRVATPEEAEDITSEAFLRTWHYLLERRDVVNFTGLVYRIARNLVIDHYRSRKANVSFNEAIEVESEEGEPLASDEGEQIRLLDTALEAHELVDLMKQLKADYRDVLLLRYLEELSVGEIAEIIGKTHVHVRVLLHRATKTIQQLLQERNELRPDTTDGQSETGALPRESAAGVGVADTQ